MAADIAFVAACGIVGLSCTAALTLKIAAITKDIWDESFGKGNVNVDQARALTDQIKNLEINIKKLISDAGVNGSHLQKNIQQLKSDSHSVGVTVSHLQKNIQELKSDSHSVGVTVRLIQEELKKETKPSYIVEFLQNDKTIYVAKVALVGAIGYGVWKWMGYSISDIRNGTKRCVTGRSSCVAGALSSTKKNLVEKSGEVGEKMRILSEQLENCGKVVEPKEMSNPNKVSEVTRNISQNGYVVDLNKKLYDLVPLEGISCKLFRMDEQDIVAEAVWMTDDPTTLVHGCELGQNASKVWITNAVDPNAKVWRPTIERAGAAVCKHFDDKYQVCCH